MSEPCQPSADLLDFLGNTELFEGLPREHLAAIAQLARQQIHDKGDVLFHRGDDGNGFYVVQVGRVKVFQLSAGGRELILHIFGEGDHFAEVPAFDGSSFPASAATLEPTTVLFFPRQRFLAFLEQNPLLTINLLKSFARHTRRLSQLIDNLSLHEVPERLAIYLLQLSDQGSNTGQIQLNLNKTQLAAMLGTIPETLSRIFYKLNQAGVIAVEGSTITVLDFDKLRQFAK